MADRNRSDLDREQRGSSNPNQTERTENREGSSQETGLGGANPNQNKGQSSGRDQGIGSETEDRGNLDSNRESGNRSGNMEGNQDLDR